MKKLLFLVVCALAILSFATPPSDNNCPSIAVSANGRFLTSDGKPFFWLGDTGWMMLEKLNRTETEKYLENRRLKGFNVIQVMLLHGLSAITVDGDSALINKNVASPKLIKGEPSEITTKRGYWENLDFVVDLAAQKGLYMAMVPIWGSNVRAGKVTSKQAETYAGFLAQRYKNKSNIIWLNGGDVRGDDSIKIWNIIGKTLKKQDPNHLITFHPFGRTQSSTWFHNESWLDFNMCQSGHRDYKQDTARADHRYGEDNWRYILSDYNRLPVKPTLDGEPSYEGIPHGLHDTLQPRWTENDIRRYAYWSVFAGACGFTYGNNSVMQMYKKGEKAGAYGATEPWDSAILAPGAGQMIHLKNLMLKYHFEELVPDQTLLPDQGEKYNRLSVLKGKNCLLVYTYNGKLIQLNADQLFANNFNYFWYSPRDGKSIFGGMISKFEKFEFDPPGDIKEGNDWVLVLEKTGQIPIPRDTTFTAYLAWTKIKKEFPQAKIVEANLPSDVKAEYGVVYATIPETPYGNRNLHLDIFRPMKAGKYPALLLVHGGGWRSGDRTMEIPMAQQIASHGYVTATVEYRLSPEALYPAAVHDIKTAIRFLRAHAKQYSVNSKRIAISGTSAGGQLAALIGMSAGIDKFEGYEGWSKHSSKIEAIIDIDGVLDFRDPNESAKDTDPAKPSAGAYWFGATFRMVPEKWIEASPIEYAGKDSPPILFINSALPRFHAGRDNVIAILNKHQIYSEVHTFPSTPHPFWLFNPWFEPTVEFMVSFLDKTMKNEK
jgi:acetyl esterase/lipase